MPADPSHHDAAGLLQAVCRHAHAVPGGIAVIETSSGDTRRTTWSELARLAGRRQARLQQVCQAGDSIVLDGPGGADFVAWIIAALAAELHVLPLPLHTTDQEAAAITRRCAATAVITDRDLPETPQRLDWGEAGDDASPTRPGQRGAVVLASSGSTGESRFVIRSHAALIADGLNVAAAMRLAPGDRVLLAIAMSHSYGMDMLAAAILSGAALDIVASFDIGAIISRLGPDAVVPAVPYLLDGLARLGRRAPAPRLVVSAGAPLPESVREMFTATWNRPVGDLYGATELGTVIYRDPEKSDPAPGFIGFALPGVSIRTLSLDDPGTMLGCECEGELAIAAPSMLSGYLDGPPPDLVDGHLRTGDIGIVHHDGRVRLTGRVKLVIEAGGVKVNPAEIERLLNQHPGVAECVILPMTVSETVTRLRAVFVPRDPQRIPSDHDLREFLRPRIAGARIPRRFEAVSELPRSTLGKIRRTELAGSDP